MLSKLLSSILFFCFCSSLLAAEGKLAVDYGYFAINAKVDEKTSSVSNPSAFRFGYLKPMTQTFELVLSYTVLLADFSGSDLGYGLDAGVNFYFFQNAIEESYQDSQIEMKKYDLWKPYAGLSFHQRNFQSVKNSYAGFGLSAGIERYWNEKMNLRGEGRFLNLGGSGESTATETALFVGVVFKL